MDRLIGFLFFISDCIVKFAVASGAGFIISLISLILYSIFYSFIILSGESASDYFEIYSTVLSFSWPYILVIVLYHILGIINSIAAYFVLKRRVRALFVYLTIQFIFIIAIGFISDLILLGLLCSVIIVALPWILARIQFNKEQRLAEQENQSIVS